MEPVSSTALETSSKVGRSVLSRETQGKGGSWIGAHGGVRGRWWGFQGDGGLRWRNKERDRKDFSEKDENGRTPSCDGSVIRGIAA